MRAISNYFLSNKIISTFSDETIKIRIVLTLEYAYTSLEAQQKGPKSLSLLSCVVYIPAFSSCGNFCVARRDCLLFILSFKIVLISSVFELIGRFEYV